MNGDEPIVVSEKKNEDAIIKTVIRTIAGLVVAYLLILGGMAIFKIEPPPEVIQAFNHAGTTLVGALIGLLMKTKSAPTPQEVKPEIKVVTPADSPMTMVNTSAPSLSTPPPVTEENPLDDPVPTKDT